MWNFNTFNDAIAVITENGQEVSYTQLNEYTKELTKNIPSRSLIFSLCSNTLGSLVGYTSFINAKTVPLMLDEHINNTQLHDLIQLYKPNFLWLPTSRELDVTGQKIYETLDYSLIKTDHTNTFELHDDLALLLTTSGSMGSPKLVRQSYKNIEANTKSIVEYLQLDAGERAITTLPMNYTYGLSIINTHLYVGATIILTSSTLMQREFWTSFTNFKATSFGGVPYTYEMLDKLRFFRRDLPSLKTMTQAGGKLSPELHKKFASYAADTGKKFIVMYGQTEATARMSYLPAEKSLKKYGSMGIAIPRGRFALIDTNGEAITRPDTVGELVYHGDNVTLGYAECGEDLAKGDDFQGKLVTGDMAKMDADGFYYIVGRKKRFLKLFGNRVNLDETERLIKAHFIDLDCACAGKDDAMQIYITDIEKIKEVQKFVAETSHINFSAFKVTFIKEIPKNEAGKTLYGKLNGE